jgi:O-succinylbenzoic acid--CoA ligase
MHGVPWLAARARGRASHPALEIADLTLSYAELERRAHVTAAGLCAAGLGAGDVVAALLPSGAPFVELLHGAALCGTPLLPLNLRLTPRELGHALRDAGVRLLVHGGGALAEQARAAAGEAGGTPTLEAAQGLPERPTKTAAAPPSPEALLAVLFTSGTTGLPKGAGLSHGNFLWSALASAVHLGMQPGDRWLACMPLFHVGGLSILLRSALYGNTVVIQPRFDPAAVNRAFDRGGITHASLVTTMLSRVLDERGARRAPPQLRCILLGGGPAPDSLLERARELGFPIAPTYGLTEATSQVATRAPGDGCVGLRPLVCNQIRIADGHDRDLPDGEPGELLVRGPTVMREYVNRPEETARVLRGGWLHTGDVAVRAGDGSLEILERRSDLIISGGENVYPSEVEQVLLAHPTVAEAAVTGIDDPDFGQRAAAWLVPRAGAKPDPEQLRAHCREHLAAYKVPVEFRTVSTLPRNAAGKLLRRQLTRAPAD